MHTPLGSQTGIMTKNNSIPELGIICAHPKRVQTLKTYLQDTKLHTDYRGYQVYTGKYQNRPIFIANTNIGSGSAAILIEELIVSGAKEIIRLGSSDNTVKNQNNRTCYLVSQTYGAYGIMREYGYDDEEIEEGVKASRQLVNKIKNVSESLEIDNFETAKAYHLDSYYAHLNAERFSKNPKITLAMAKKYRNKGATVRDMESATLFMLGQLRGIQTACILQSVIKHGVAHEYKGQTQVLKREKEIINLALEALVS